MSDPRYAKSKSPVTDLRTHPDHLGRFMPQRPSAKAKPAPQLNPAPQEQTASAVVRRTIHAPTGRTVTIGYDAEKGTPITRAICQWYGPGEEVHLPRSEIARLTKLGYLVDDQKVADQKAAQRVAGGLARRKIPMSACAR